MNQGPTSEQQESETRASFPPQSPPNGDDEDEEETRYAKDVKHPLYQIRQLRNLSRQEIVKKTQLGYTTIQQIEGGRCEPTFKTRQKLADGLNLPQHVVARWFMDDKENMPVDEIMEKYYS